ncbi:MAG: 1-deoxy-D-xylulose-5-phosphate reductoisomerase [Oscillospiraceae bacterium]|jgi:1-deoxy-D-xylulose-5-phosphate reductoisomerase|nr:1-deoxy-D-xylulose-5-phosphate reductoisomerase [Oscillospiraceae bacterium]
MVNGISILGSTGSIGRQTVAAAKHLGVPVKAISVQSNIELAERQARELNTELVAVYDEDAAKALRRRLCDTNIRVAGGEAGLIEAAVIPSADCVVTAVSGAVGLKPTLAAIDTGRRIALANKETLVCAGTIVMARAAEKGAEIVPVDSEHSAIFQCLTGRERTELYRILLTGSGGPFRGKPVSELRDITPAQAVKHPNWSMGAKISVDSATMMNKGLEFIEAMYLFACTPDEIQVIIHPESIIHSMVELVDGTVIAQLGVPDMGLPIQLALTWPERGPSMSERLDFAALGKLTFEAPDLAKVPCLGLAMDCARRGGTATAILNAANEVAVALFLQEKIGFTQIYDCVSKALDSMEICSDPNLEEILDADRRARNFVREHFD